MLSDTGYAVIPGPFDASKLETVTSAIDKAAAAASHEEIKVGSSGSNVRIDGLLAKMPALERLFTHPPVVAAAEELIGPFRLSSFHMRTVLPGAEAQALHQDVRPYCDGWPLLGFIFMMDVFTPENGATRFVPGSQKIETMPAEFLRAHPAQVHACGPVGSMILLMDRCGTASVRTVPPSQGGPCKARSSRRAQAPRPIGRKCFRLPSGLKSRLAHRLSFEEPRRAAPNPARSFVPPPSSERRTPPAPA